MNEDQNTWLEEVRNCKKLKKRDMVVTRNPKNTVIAIKTSNPDYSAEISSLDFLKGTEGHCQVLEKNESLGIDRRADRKLRAGKIKIDRKIDFHGLTLDEAFDSLVYNLVQAQEAGLRCVLVITGKGKNTEPGRISIKSQIGNWLKIPILASKIIKYIDATSRHGGTGALYILLKRNKVASAGDDPL
ncbi:MAG: Smr/MutS family protein [Rickettsiales bacterium]|jgi:DNA-nicking Smr family endonuclease|nr:Smr/MutS family protein [Rickettsiales bacterium]